MPLLMQMSDICTRLHQYFAIHTVGYLYSSNNLANANMRRNNNYPYQPLNQNPGPSRLAHDNLEEENEKAAEELKQKIGALKSLTIDIGNEVRYQDKLLRGMDDDMERTHGFLGNTMQRVVRLGKNAGGRHMCYMFLFVVFVFLILYLVLKIK